jgi:hypothetical protein
MGDLMWSRFERMLLSTPRRGQGLRRRGVCLRYAAIAKPLPMVEEVPGVGPKAVKEDSGRSLRRRVERNWSILE